VVEGEGAYTTVDGARCEMLPGDLILTPAGSWHDHTNASAAPMIWLDGLDGPLVQALNAAFFENRPEAMQPVQREADEGLRYPWRKARAQLEAIAEADEDPFDAARLAYPALPTLACEASRLAPGRRTRSHRHASVAMYHVFEGQGRTQVGDEVIEWERGDTFVVPLWQWHDHENTGAQDAFLFSMNDTPVMRALGLYREEAR
jgi:gentisate 1,2-dioxygenase